MAIEFKATNLQKLKQRKTPGDPSKQSTWGRCKEVERLETNYRLKVYQIFCFVQCLVFMVMLLLQPK